MEERDPLDEYVGLLQREAEESDENMSFYSEQQWSMTEHLKHAAFRFEANRQRYEADLESEERAAEQSKSGS